MSGTWSDTGDLDSVRFDHTVTLLPNGKVLVAGGEFQAPVVTDLYDPETGTWAATGGLANPRTGHTATLLSNGKVLVAGGEGLASAELYHKENGSWAAMAVSPTHALSTRRRCWCSSRAVLARAWNSTTREWNLDRNREPKKRISMMQCYCFKPVFAVS